MHTNLVPKLVVAGRNELGFGGLALDAAAALFE